MTNKEILRKAIDCVIVNGWCKEYSLRLIEVSDSGLSLEMDSEPVWFSTNDLVFDHDFAKAFWGTFSVSDDRGGFYEAWQYHLRQMVLEENPLKYIKKFL